MEQLNDDCLITIFKLVGLADQLALALVSWRFRSVLQDYIWAYEQRHARLDCNKIAIDLERFHVYATYLLPFAEVVNLRGLPEELLHALIGYSFPKVHDLTFSSGYLFGDEQLVVLSGIFPNLKTFCPHTALKGECLVHFEKVENLILCCSSQIELQHFIAAIRTLKLKSLELGISETPVPPLGEDLRHLYGLERLALNNLELAWLYEAEDEAAFTHLREIIVLEDMTYQQMTILFEFLCKFKGGNVAFLEFNYCQNLGRIFRQTSYSFYARLEKMFFFNLPNNEHLKIRQGISTRFPELQEIYFYGCMLKRVTEVLRLFESDVELLDIEECTTYFRILRIPIEIVGVNRQRPLTLNFNNNFYRRHGTEEAVPVILQYEETDVFNVTDVETIFQPYGSVRIVF